MDFTMCEKGHVYDGSIHTSCPECAKEAGNNYQDIGPTGMGMEAIQPTEPVGAGYQDVGATQPVGMGVEAIQPTEPVGAGYQRIDPTLHPGNPGFTPTDYAPDVPPVGPIQQGGVQDYRPTMPEWTGGARGFDPVTGWLVCVKGPSKGTDYRIRNGYNYIGRAQHMSICILNDDHISYENHAFIGYDSETQVFMFGPDKGRNIIRVNGEPVFSAVKLEPYDELTIGKTKLRFVPFCGEKFNWEMEDGIKGYGDEV